MRLQGDLAFGLQHAGAPTLFAASLLQFISPQELVLAQARGVPVLDVRPPGVAAADLLRVIEGLTPKDTGGFFDFKGEVVAW